MSRSKIIPREFAEFGSNTNFAIRKQPRIYCAFTLSRFSILMPADRSPLAHSRTRQHPLKSGSHAGMAPGDRPWNQSQEKLNSRDTATARGQEAVSSAPETVEIRLTM